MATTSTSALFTRSLWLSNATGTPKSLLAASADSRRLVDSAVIWKSSESDFNAGMCACAAHPRSGLATKLISLPSHSSFVVAGITLAVLATSIMLMLVALTLRGQPYMLWADLVFGFVASGLLLLGLYQIRRSTA